MLDIFEYADYRKFIQDYQLAKSKLNSAFSFRYLAQKAGINSSSFYTQIIKGNRNLTKQTIYKTCLALNLDDIQAEYFENLVFFNQANTIKDKNHFFEKLIEKQKVRTVKKVKEENYDYFSEWYHATIREVVTFFDFKNNYKKLASFIKPEITIKQAKDSVELLLKLGFLEKKGNKFFQTEPLISSDSGTEFKIHRIINYQIKMLELVKESYDRWPSEERLTSATTYSISEQTYKQFVEILRNSRSQMMKLTESDLNADRVYLLSMNLIPLSSKKGEGNV